ncbi:MAG: hypothetical protein WDN08_20780 [Rhizomicrobium sp.]
MTLSASSVRRFAGALLVTTSLTMIALAEPAQASDLDRFFNSGYTYCDAKLIGDLWGIGVDEAKTQIGMKIRTGIGGNIPRVLRLSRQGGNACTWEDTGLSYDDAVQLADLWGLSEPYRAKLKVARYYTRGESAIVTRALAGGYGD